MAKNCWKPQNDACDPALFRLHSRHESHQGNSKWLLHDLLYSGMCTPYTTSFLIQAESYVQIEAFLATSINLVVLNSPFLASLQTHNSLKNKPLKYAKYPKISLWCLCFLIQQDEIFSVQIMSLDIKESSNAEDYTSVFQANTYFIVTWASSSKWLIIQGKLYADYPSLQ